MHCSNCCRFINRWPTVTLPHPQGDLKVLVKMGSSIPLSHTYPGKHVFLQGILSCTGGPKFRQLPSRSPPCLLHSSQEMGDVESKNICRGTRHLACKLLLETHEEPRFKFQAFAKYNNAFGMILFNFQLNDPANLKIFQQLS